MHHTGEAVHNNGYWPAFNRPFGDDTPGDGYIPTGGYHELILRNGRVQIINTPEAIV